MSPSETSTLAAAHLMFEYMWDNGAYHLTTLAMELNSKGVKTDVIAKLGLAQLKLEQKGVIKRIGPNIWTFAGAVSTPAVPPPTFAKAAPPEAA